MTLCILICGLAKQKPWILSIWDFQLMFWDTGSLKIFKIITNEKLFFFMPIFQK